MKAVVVITVEGGVAEFSSYGDVEVVKIDYDLSESGCCAYCGDELPEFEDDETFCSQCRDELQMFQIEAKLDLGVFLNIV